MHKQINKQHTNFNNKLQKVKKIKYFNNLWSLCQNYLVIKDSRILIKMIIFKEIAI